MELDVTKDDCQDTPKDKVFHIQRILVGKRKKGHPIVLKDNEVVLGRHPESTVVIASENVSRRHAILTRTADSYDIQDAGSLNGVWVNKDKQRPLVPRVLVSGDIFCLGDPEETQHTFLFSSHLGKADDSPPPSSKVARAATEQESARKKELDEQVKKLQQELEEKKEAERRLQERLEVQQREHQESLEQERERVLRERQEGEARLRQELEQQMEGEQRALQEQRTALLAHRDRVEQELRQKLTQEMQDALLKEQQRLNKDLEESSQRALKLEEQLAQSRHLQTQSKSDMIHRFGDLLETELNCSICSELFTQAHTLGCSHTFCKHCISLWKKKKNECPICRAKIKSMVHALVVDNFIEQMVSNLSPQLKVNRIKLLKERGLPCAHLEKELLNVSGALPSSSASPAPASPFQISILPTTSGATAVTLRQPSILLRPVNGTSLPPGFQSLLGTVPGASTTFQLVTVGGVQTLQRVNSAPAPNTRVARPLATSVASNIRPSNVIRPSGGVRPAASTSSVRPGLISRPAAPVGPAVPPSTVARAPFTAAAAAATQAPRAHVTAAERRGGGGGARTRGGRQPPQTGVIRRSSPSEFGAPTFAENSEQNVATQANEEGIPVSEDAPLVLFADQFEVGGTVTVEDHLLPISGTNTVPSEVRSSDDNNNNAALTGSGSGTSQSAAPASPVVNDNAVTNIASSADSNNPIIISDSEDDSSNNNNNNNTSTEHTSEPMSEPTSSFRDSEEESDGYSDYGPRYINGAYYGGYGRCYRCGERGHWANGCRN